MAPRLNEQIKRIPFNVYMKCGATQGQQMKITIDEDFSGLIQPLQDEEYENLTQSILDDGCRDALVLWNDTIIDGHNRYNICSEHGVDFNILHMDFDSKEDAMLWMIRNQQGRRNLSKANRGKLVLKKKDLVAALAKENLVKSGKEYGKGSPTLANPIDTIDTRKILAKEAGVSTGTLGKIEAVEDRGTKELKEVYTKTNMDVSVNLADKVARLEEDDQREFVKKVEKKEEKPTEIYNEIVSKNKAARKPKKIAGNFKRLAEHCHSFSEGLQLFAEGTMVPDGELEAVSASMLLNSAPNIIMQYVRLGVDIKWCYELAIGATDERIENGSEEERPGSSTVIDITPD